MAITTPIGGFELPGAGSAGAASMDWRARAEHVAPTGTSEGEPRFDARLRHAQRLDTLGSLAAGMAHDFSNLLTPILGTSEQLLHGAEQGVVAREGLREIWLAARRAKQAVDRVLSFARLDQGEGPRVLHVPLLAREAMELIARSIPASATIEAVIDDECEPVCGSPDELLQAITNLCVNACHALRSSGTRLSLSVRQVQLEPSFAQLHAMEVGQALVVIVEDDGPGMSEDVLERAFEPFFTTKPVGEGTGMGLSMVRAIAAGHGGIVLAHSKPGAGARFELFLPTRSQKSKEEAVGESRQERDGVARAHVVCIDDEFAVLKTFELIIAHAGHKVTMFASPTEALAWLRQHSGEPDLVITDQTMPELSGIEVADRLREFAPHIPVILISGYADVNEDSPRSNIKLTLCKPVGYDALLRAVQEALEPRAVVPAR